MKNLIGILIIGLIACSCEKVIQVDLNEADPAMVIEGNLSFGSGELEVKLSQTTSYFNNEPVPKVENAVVVLDNGPGYHLQAEHAGEGRYTIGELRPHVGSVYRLTVNAGGQEYTAVSRLAPQVKIDSLHYEYQQPQFFVEEGFRILLYYFDPPDEDNYYRIKLYKNGVRFDTVNDLIVFDDSTHDGKSIQVRLRGHLFEAGDTVRVELLSIDHNAWAYFSSLQETTNLNPGSPSPTNPVSNFSNGALGYFAVWSSSSRTIILPE